MKNTLDPQKRGAVSDLGPSKESAGRPGRALALWRWLSMGCFCVGAAALLGVLAFFPAESLSAANRRVADNDRDGLPNLLEMGLASSPDTSDSDGDGFTDGEEFARGTSPTKFYEKPTGNEASIRLGAYVDTNGSLRGVAALYAPDGSVNNKGFNVGVYFNSAPAPALLPRRSYLPQTRFREIQVGAQASVFLFYFPLSVELLQLKGSLSYFVTMSENGVVTVADALDLVYSEGTVLEVINILRKSELPSGAQVAGKPGLIFQPVGGSPIPDLWIAGALCYQGVETVGFAGAVVTQQIVSADCQQGWDGYCDPVGCAASVGGTIETLDPGVLIGG